MKILVCSRGSDSETDYVWVNVTEKGLEQIYNFPSLFQEEFTNLIYSESPSVVLSRRKGQLLLLITAILPRERFDFYQRQIRISVAWIGEDSRENEVAFRLLAARALDEAEKQQLTLEIARMIPLGGIHGFEVDFQKLLSLISSCKIQYKVDSQQLTELEEKLNKLAQISPTTKHSLVQMLRKFQLPQREGVLIVSTDIKKEKILKQALVWRGLSSLVQSPDWQAYYPFPKPLPIENAEGLNFKIQFFELFKNINQSWANLFMSNIEFQVNQKLQSK